MVHARNNGAMAATQTRPAAAPRILGSADGAAAAREGRAPILLGAALAAALLYAAFASGAIRIPEESRLQVLVAAIALATLAATLFGALRFDASPRAVAGLWLLGGFAAWSALSITWSIAPDETWLEVNRAIAYALVAAIAVVLGSSLPRALERIALGYLAVAGLVALYALGGKLVPWVQIPGLLDLDHLDRISRLRAPIEYWNALALFCVLAIPVAVRAAADLERSARFRGVSLVALVILFATLALTYSRGGLLVLVVALAVLLAIGPDRATLAAVTGIGILGALPAVLFAVTSPDLTTSDVGGVPLSSRVPEGLIVLAALLVGLALALVLHRRITASPGGLSLSPQATMLLRRGALAAAAGAAVLLLAALALSDRGLTGTIDARIDSFTAAKADRQNDPARILQTNSGNRWVWWKEAAGAWWDRPLVGHGAGSFPLVHRAYRTNSLEVRQPHSVPLEFLSETGLIGAGLALGGLALLGLAATSSALGRAPSRERAYGAALLAGCAAWAVHIWIDWDWDIPAVTLPTMIFLGALVARPAGGAASNGALPRPSTPALARGPALAAGAALLCLVALSAVLPAVSKEMTSDALSLAAKGGAGNLREAAEKAEVASRLNPFAVQPPSAAASIAQRSGQPAKAARLLSEAVRRQPDNPLMWFRLAGFQRQLNDSPAALRSIAMVRALDPYHSLVGLLRSDTVFDERSSATATGTPLPEGVEQPAPAPEEPAPPQPSDEDGDPPRPPSTPAPPPSSAPSPAAPRPAPQAPPTPRAPAPRPPAPEQPEGEPFRFEG